MHKRVIMRTGVKPLGGKEAVHTGMVSVVSAKGVCDMNDTFLQIAGISYPAFMVMEGLRAIDHMHKQSEERLYEFAIDARQKNAATRTLLERLVADVRLVHVTIPNPGKPCTATIQPMRLRSLMRQCDSHAERAQLWQALQGT